MLLCSSSNSLVVWGLNMNVFGGDKGMAKYLARFDPEPPWI